MFLDLKIKKLEQELHNANEMLAAKKSGKLSISDEDVGRMYPTAAATSRLLTSGMTLTQVDRHVSCLMVNSFYMCKLNFTV